MKTTNMPDELKRFGPGDEEGTEEGAESGTETSEEAPAE